MKILRFLALVVLLNIIRYVVAGLIEGPLILPHLFGAMAASPDYFATSFETIDWVTSYFYNFVVWLAVAWSFHLMRPSLAKNDVVASLQAFGVGWVFFAGLSFVYMNHYSHPKSFYVWNVLDAVVTFTVVGIANGLLYRRLMGRHAVKAERRE